MKKLFLNLALLLAVSICIAAPRIDIPQPKSDAGKTDQGDPINFSVEIFNKGDQTLKITPYSGCKCGTVDVEPEIAPGSMVLLKYYVKTDDMQGQTTRTVVLRTNDPKRPSITLPFRMNVIPPVWIEPTGTQLINLAPTASAKRVFTVKSSTPGQVVLGEPSGTPQYCTTEVKGNTVTCIVRSTAPVGKSRFHINLPVLRPRKSTVSVDVVVNKGIVMEPQSVYLGSYQPKTKKVMKARVVMNSMSGFTITGVKANRELSVVTHWLRDNSWSLDIMLSKPIAKGVYRSIVVVSTDQASQKQIEIPVVAIRN